MNPIAIGNDSILPGTPHADPVALRETISAVEQDRSLGKVRFSASSVSNGAVSARCMTGPLKQGDGGDMARIGRFEWLVDEPASLLGTDTAPNPAEYILAGLAGCYTVTLTQLAALKGIELSRIDLNLGFDIDLAGFLDIDSTVRPGASGISIDVALASHTATEEELQELASLAERFSPIRDTLANPVAVRTSLSIAVLDATGRESVQTAP